MVSESRQEINAEMEEFLTNSYFSVRWIFYFDKFRWTK